MRRDIVGGVDRSGNGIAHSGAAGWRVPFGAPGDVVEINAATGAAALAEPSSTHRAVPPCPHFSRCGGCQFQHLSDPFVAEWKRVRVLEALRTQGLSPVVEPTRTVGPRSRRRARFTLQRTKKSTLLGFLSRGSHHVVDLSTCPVLAPEIEATLPAIRGLGRLGASRKRALSITVTATDNGLDIDVAGGKDVDAPLFSALAAAAAAADLARLSWNSDLLVERRPATVRFDRVPVKLPPGAFLQATAETETILLELIERSLGAADLVADLFCGCGTFSVPMARDREVHAYDEAAEAVASLREAARQAGIPRLHASRRDLFRDPVPAGELDRFDCVVFDPPRAGARAQAAEIAASKAERVIAISCEPRSFARDARLLVDGGYEPRRIVPVDQFRWSPHVEVFAEFARTRF